MKHAKTVKINPHTLKKRETEWKREREREREEENTISDYKAFSALELRGLKEEAPSYVFWLAEGEKKKEREKW
jgi:hypothetical protein